MDEQNKTLVVTTSVLLLIALIVFGTIFYLVRVLQSRQKLSSQAAKPSPAIVRVSSSPKASQAVSTSSANSNAGFLPSNTKLYKGSGFLLNYPKNWGLLTCKDYPNIEFDPENSTDQLDSVCDFAVWPITVLVGSTEACSGTTTKIGKTTVFKSKTPTQTGIDYRWCTKTPVSLDITERVSSAPLQATSPKDFSPQVEQLISTISYNNNP